MLNLALLYPSLLMCITSMLLLRFYPGWLCGAVSALSVVFLTIIASMAYAVANFFTGDGINDAALFHLLHAIDFKIAIVFWPVLISVLIVFVALMCLYRYFMLRWRFRGQYLYPKNNTRFFNGFMVGLGWCFAISAILINPATVDSYVLWEKFHASKKAKDISLYLGKTKPNHSKLKNFIYIYAEGFEKTYFDESRFPGLVVELKHLEKQALSIEGIGQAPMTNWTIAGMTASQCGVPLATFQNGKNPMRVRGEFLPGVFCAGDLLKEAEYHLVYMGGADKKFAGKDNFYGSHGFSEVYGKQELEEYAGRPLEFSKWGVFDDDMFGLAYKKWISISTSFERYGLFLLTLDTHSPIGHKTPSCKNYLYADGSNSMLNAVHCSDRLLAEFIEKIMNSPGAEDLVIVLGSDHLVMMNYVGLEFEDPSRTNMFMVFSKDIHAGKIVRHATTLDIAPTFLSLVGFDANAFGLGRNLLDGAPTLTEQMGKQEFFEQLTLWQTDLWDGWNKRSANGDN